MFGWVHLDITAVCYRCYGHKTVCKVYRAWSEEEKVFGELSGWTVALLMSQGRQPLTATKLLNIQHIEPWSRTTTSGTTNGKLRSAFNGSQKLDQRRLEKQCLVRWVLTVAESPVIPNQTWRRVRCSAPDLKSIVQLQHVVKWEICMMDVQLTNLRLCDAVSSTWTTFFHHRFYATKI